MTQGGWELLSSITQLLCEGMHFAEPLDAEGHYFGFGLLDECLVFYLTQGGDTGSRPSSFLGFCRSSHHEH